MFLRRERLLIRFKGESLHPVPVFIGEVGVVMVTDGKVSSRRGGTQARIRLHVHDQEA